MPSGRPLQTEPSKNLSGNIIFCPCGEWHRLTPTAMAAVLQEFIDGNAQTIGKGGEITAKCIVETLGAVDRKSGRQAERMRAESVEKKNG